ncbi:phosphate-binding protein [Salmonella enterica subsp. enterica]|nr:phosphate-binding protein [Salmonella enterica subsp. enterica]
MVMAFIGVPLLVNIITIIVGGMWACISVLENSIPVAQSIEKATIIPVALLGAGLIFLCGRIWGKGNASEVNPEWRDCCLAYARSGGTDGVGHPDVSHRS